MRFNYFSAGNAVWRTLLALILLTSSGWAQIAQPSENATPPAEQPAYAALAANIFPKPWRIGSHSKISRFPNCGGCMGSKAGAGCLRAFCGSRPSADLCAVHTEQCCDRRTLRRSSGFLRIAIIHAVRRGYGRARPADRAPTAGAVLACHRPLARIRSKQAARRSLHERRARPPA